MKNIFLLCIATGILNLALFAGVFRSFQNERFYTATLGKISENYQRTGSWDNYEITKVAAPFTEVSDQHFLNWDAGIYKCISERLYLEETECAGKVRAAFFPLFPLLWRLTGASAAGISIINYFIFIVSIAILVQLLLNTSVFDKLMTFWVLITLPSVVSYHIPYSEALFLFAMTIAVAGIMKKQYLLYFSGSVLLATVRPATVFIFTAIVCIEFFLLYKNRDLRLFMKEIVLKSVPFLIGFGVVLFIQFHFSRSWNTFFEARRHWNTAPLNFNISDWSVEGFGLAVFAIFFIIIPAIYFLLFVFIKGKDTIVKKFIESPGHESKTYLILLSILYFVGIFLFTIITQGGNLHSLSRYVLASPLLYISVLLLSGYLSGKPQLKASIIFGILALCAVIFIATTEYGGDRINFSMAGLYLYILSGLFLLSRNSLSKTSEITFAAMLIIMNTVWNTYLLNMFFSDGWVFT